MYTCTCDCVYFRHTLLSCRSHSVVWYTLSLDSAVKALQMSFFGNTICSILRSFLIIWKENKQKTWKIYKTDASVHVHVELHVQCTTIEEVLLYMYYGCNSLSVTIRTHKLDTCSMQCAGITWPTSIWEVLSAKCLMGLLSLSSVSLSSSLRNARLWLDSWINRKNWKNY